LNEPLIKYEELYSEYLALVMEIHNYNAQFLKFDKVKAREGMQLRRSLKKMKALQKELLKYCLEGERKHWELNPPKRGARFQETTKWPRRKKKNVVPPGSDRK
jgi:hypothetical protein